MKPRAARRRRKGRQTPTSGPAALRGVVPGACGGSPAPQPGTGAGQGLDGLRLRLKFDLGDPNRDYLAALPWELLRDSRLNAAVATDIRTPLGARPRAPACGKALGVPSTLRILVVDAAPRTLAELNMELEGRPSSKGPVEHSSGRSPLLGIDVAGRDEGEAPGRGGPRAPLRRPRWVRRAHRLWSAVLRVD